jgi:hypothetical protein
MQEDGWIGSWMDWQMDGLADLIDLWDHLADGSHRSHGKDISIDHD